MHFPKIISYLVWFVISFPFIPALVPGTDNQPTFTLLFFSMMLLACMKPQVLKLSFINKYVVSVVFILISAFLIGLFYNIIVFEKSPYLTRAFSFIQFLVAMIFGATTLYTLPRSWLQNILWVYVVFTVLFFLTGGLIEEFLIRSRIEGVSELLAISGRGARTLSPEPSIMAIHILNMILLFNLTRGGHKINYKNLMLAMVPLLGSLSGYGFFIAFALILIFHPKFFIGICIFIFLIFDPFLSTMEFNGTRNLLIIKGLKENGLNFLFEDQSFNSRIDSFLEYKNSFFNTFPFGDAFTIFSGGGIISIISALGLVGVLFFLGILLLLLISNYSLTVKALFFVWLTVYFISGSFGVPLFGLILGVFITNSFKHDKNIDTISSL